MKSKGRWRLAQESERKWWEKQITKIDFGYFAEFARDCVRSLHGVAPIVPATRILEIGSGPAGILTHLPSKFRCGVDPLEFFYGRTEKCSRFRDREVRYLAAQGESLPFANDSFDFIIIDNILDHCEDIDAVFNEIARVLAKGGIVYLRNFTHTAWGIILAGMLEFFRIDRGHPFHFQEKDLHSLCVKKGLEPILIERRGFLRHFQSLIASKKISHIIRALSFSQADKVLFVLRNDKS
jgi:ubiquinone/menaquinone biosynthesis C-methylase UbiE